MKTESLHRSRPKEDTRHSSSREAHEIEFGNATDKQPSPSAQKASKDDHARDKTSHAHPVGPRILSLQEAAVYLGCCERTVKDLILDGVIPQVELTSRIQVDILDLDKLIESRKKIYEYQN